MSDSPDNRELRPRVKAALEYLEHCRLVTQPFSDSVANDRSRELYPIERTTFNAAVSMLNQYFSGEIDLGDTPLYASCEADQSPEEKAKEEPEAAEVK